MRKILFLAALGFALGCGQSPLLHHVNADELGDGLPRPGAFSPERQQAEDPCALYLRTVKLCADVVWTVQQTEEIDGEFVLSFYDPARGTAQGGPYADPAQGAPAIQLWMPGMGHGVERKPRIARESEGRYRVSRVIFSMSGDWDVRIQLKDGATVLDQAVLRYTY